MTLDIPFRIALFILMIVLLALRLHYHTHAGTMRESWKSTREGLAIRVLRLSVLPGLIAILVYLIYPPWMAWSSMALPEWVRWFGVGLGVADFFLFWWIHRALGKNFNTTLYIRPGHTLVTHGPYRWVRHPMYTAIALWMLSVGLISANWFLLIFGLAVIGLVIVLRTHKEEAMLIEAFGDDYRAYRRRTGLLLPRLMPVRG